VVGNPVHDLIRPGAVAVGTVMRLSLAERYADSAAYVAAVRAAAAQMVAERLLLPQDAERAIEQRHADQALVADHRDFSGSAVLHHVQRSSPTVGALLCPPPSIREAF
jgi:hypothetical protein